MNKKTRIVVLGGLLACACAGDRSGDGQPGARPSDRTGAGAAAVPAPASAGSTPPASPPSSGSSSPPVLVVPDAGTRPTSPNPDVPLAPGECGAVAQMAQNTYQPVDIIVAVDTSGSMAEEVAEMQAKLNAFSEQIITSGIDVSVIMLSELRGASLPPLTVDGPCIAAPLGSGQCPDDSNPPFYVHINTPVGSWDALDVFVSAYPMYKQHLRERSLKTFVTITDDDAVSPFGDEPPALNSADKFIAAVAALEPAGSSMWSSWRYSSIYCFTTCPFASRIGTVHADLVTRTQGVGGDLCLQDFGPVFDALAKQVVDVVTLACDWEIPAPPNGETFDASKTNVQLTLDASVENLRKAPDVGGCGTNEGWYYDDESAPRRVIACPSTCSRIQATSAARVDLVFGCETLVIPL